MTTRAVRAAKWVVACLSALALAAVTVAPAAADNSIAIPIVDLGVTIELKPYVQLPDGSNGGRPRPRLNQFATTGDRLFVLEDFDGLIYEIERFGSSGRGSLFFDVKSAIAAATDRKLDLTNSFHGGLRSVAFHPEFAQNGLFYTALMESRPSNPNPADYLSDDPNPIVADGVLIEWTYSHASDTVDPASYRQVFRVGMPVYDHAIKQMTFNPFSAPGDSDYGMLYIGHGDGSIQSATAGGGLKNDALGKVLRIDPRASNGQPYRVPADNPFVGDPSMIDEVYSVGHRNPQTTSKRSI